MCEYGVCVYMYVQVLCMCVCISTYLCQIKTSGVLIFHFLPCSFESVSFRTLELSKQSTEPTDPPVSGAHDAGVTGT